LASLGHPSKFQPVSCVGFVSAPTSFNGGQQTFAGCLAISWAGTLYITFLGALAPNRILPGANFTLCPSLAFCYCTALEQCRSAKICGIVQGMELRNYCRGRHLYSAGRPSRWASAHILVVLELQLRLSGLGLGLGLVLGLELELGCPMPILECGYWKNARTATDGMNRYRLSILYICSLRAV